MSLDFNELDQDALATFIQEYVRRENEPDAGTHAVIASQLRDPRYLPHHVAEMLLGMSQVQTLIKVCRSAYRRQDTKEVSIETISADMEVIYQDAKNARQFTAAISAKKLQAELHGMLVENVNINVKHSVETMTDAQLEAIAKRQVVDGEFTDVTPTAPGLPTLVHERT